jgi:hypothetical protein
LFAEDAQCEAEVLKKSFEKWKCVLIADRFLSLFKAAELQEGLAAGLVWSHALLEIVLDVEGQMGSEFGL